MFHEYSFSMTEKPDHLMDDAGAALAESIDERVYSIRSKRWISYPKAIEILGHLNALLKHPRRGWSSTSRRVAAP